MPIGTMRVAAGISAAIHLALIGVMYRGLPLFYDPDVVVLPPVFEVEFVPLAEETKITPPEPEKEPAPAPAIAKEEAPEPEPEPAKPDKTAEPEPEPEPEPVVEEPAPPKPVEQAAKPKPKPKAVKRPPPKPRLRPKIANKPPPEPNKKRPEFDPKRLIAKLDKKLKERPRPAVVQPKSDIAPVDLPRPAAISTNIGRQVTISELDRIRSHIARNWSPNWGAPGIELMVVRIRIFLKTDGSLSRPPEIVEKNPAGQSEHVFRAFADSALRAVLKSVPLPMPREKYEAWREIEFTFSLKEMLG